MIPAPHTYSEWVNVLEVLRNKTNDVDALEAMKAGTIEWQSGVAERFSKPDLSRARGQEGAIIQSVLALRREMSFLLQAVNLPAIPEDERQYYLNLVVEQANAIQESLENSAKNDRSGKLSSMVRNHKVNSF